MGNHAIPAQIEKRRSNVKFVNLTYHPINLISDSGESIEIEAIGKVARVASLQVLVDHIGGYPVYQSKLGDVINLPEPEDGVVYITSMLVASKVNRRDVVSPNTAPHSVVRDESGNVIGVKGFQTFWGGYDEVDPAKGH
jgi:hypothetical protein